MLSSISFKVIQCMCKLAKSGKDNEFAFFYIFRQQELLQEELEKKLDQAETQLVEAREKISQLEAEVQKLENDAAAQRSNIITSKPARRTVRSGQQRISRQESKRKQT